jgi:hypothetical protein
MRLGAMAVLSPSVVLAHPRAILTRLRCRRCGAEPLARDILLCLEVVTREGVGPPLRPTRSLALADGCWKLFRVPDHLNGRDGGWEEIGRPALSRLGQAHSRPVDKIFASQCNAPHITAAPTQISADCHRPITEVGLRVGGHSVKLRALAAGPRAPILCRQSPLCYGFTSQR